MEQGKLQSPNADSQQPITSSWGEYLLPFLFAGMETCWIDAILVCLANTGILGTTKSLLPLWTPFLLIAVFYSISRYLDQHLNRRLSSSAKREGMTPAGLLLIPLISLATLFGIWVSNYASQISLFDPGWLLNLPSVILQFNAASFQILCVIALATSLCRHGDFLARNHIHPPQVFKMLRFGSIIFIVLIVFWTLLEITGRVFHDTLTFVALVSLFFCLSLATHALARIVFLRHRHLFRRTGNIVTHERLALQIVLTLSFIFLLIALGGGRILGGPLTGVPLEGASLQKPKPLPTVSSVEIPPVCHNNCNTPLPESRPTKNPASANMHVSSLLPSQVLFVLNILLVLLLLTIIIILVLWIRRHLHKRSNEPSDELHESLWSLFLFWEQFQGFLRLHVQRFISRWIVTKRQQNPVEEVLYTPTTHSIHEIYRSLLKSAASYGYPRAQYETPYEFSVRLSQEIPLIEQQLARIAEAYVATRYGGTMPDDKEVTEVEYIWGELEQRWRQARESMVCSL